MRLVREHLGGGRCQFIGQIPKTTESGSRVASVTRLPCEKWTLYNVTETKCYDIREILVELSLKETLSLNFWI